MDEVPCKQVVSIRSAGRADFREMAKFDLRGHLEAKTASEAGKSRFLEKIGD